MGTSRRRVAMAVVGAIALVLLARTRRPTDDGESSGASVTIDSLEESERSAAARVIGEAFATEALTTAAFGGSVPHEEDEYERGIELLLSAHAGAGEPVLIAKRDEAVVGVAAISRPGRSWAPFRLAGLLARHSSVAFGLLGRLDWAGVWNVARTIHPPRRLPSPYYRLDAIGVTPAAQGEGVGRALLDAIHDLVEHDPAASGIYLVTGEESNRRLYERFGYVTVETRQSKGVVAYHMFRPTRQDRTEDN